MKGQPGAIWCLLDALSFLNRLPILLWRFVLKGKGQSRITWCCHASGRRVHYWKTGKKSVLDKQYALHSGLHLLTLVYSISWHSGLWRNLHCLILDPNQPQHWPLLVLRQCIIMETIHMLGEVWGQDCCLHGFLCRHWPLYCVFVLWLSAVWVLTVTASKGVHQNKGSRPLNKEGIIPHSFKLFTEIIDHWLYTNSTTSTSTLPSTRPTLLVVCYINLGSNLLKQDISWPSQDNSFAHLKLLRLRMRQ